MLTIQFHFQFHNSVVILRCDGSVIPAPSPWKGETTPNINGEERFLRGGLDDDQLQIEEDSLQAHTHGVSDSGHSHGYDDKYMSPPCDDHYGNSEFGILRLELKTKMVL